MESLVALLMGISGYHALDRGRWDIWLACTVVGVIAIVMRYTH